MHYSSRACDLKLLLFMVTSWATTLQTSDAIRILLKSNVSIRCSSAESLGFILDDLRTLKVLVFSGRNVCHKRIGKSARRESRPDTKWSFNVHIAFCTAFILLRWDGTKSKSIVCSCLMWSFNNLGH